MEKGYIKLYRAIDDNELLANDNTCYIVFSKLLTHADRHTGTYVTGRFKFAALCNLKPTTLYAALKRLESMTMIRQHSDNKMTAISICNWWKYQQDDDSTVTELRRANDTKQEREREKEITYVNEDSLTAVSDQAFFSELVTLLGFDATKTKFLVDRKRKLALRLKQFSADEIKRAAQNLADSPYHQGENPAGRRYGDIDFLLRNDAQIEKWRDVTDKQTTYKAAW